MPYMGTFQSDDDPRIKLLEKLEECHCIDKVSSQYKGIVNVLNLVVYVSKTHVKDALFKICLYGGNFNYDEIPDFTEDTTVYEVKKEIIIGQNPLNEDDVNSLLLSTGLIFPRFDTFTYFDFTYQSLASTYQEYYDKFIKILISCFEEKIKMVK
jgi:hypothetical protein